MILEFHIGVVQQVAVVVDDFHGLAALDVELARVERPSLLRLTRQPSEAAHATPPSRLARRSNGSALPHSP